MPSDSIKSSVMTLQSVKLDLSRPRVMAIINATPDSFYSDSRFSDEERLRRGVKEAIEQGAYMLDVGGYSSRPGADDVSVEEECRRVGMAMRIIRELSPDIIVSIDTFRSQVVRYVVERFGGVVVNDISASAADPKMIDTVVELGLPYIAMHMRGTPSTMQSLTDYDDIAQEVRAYFESLIAELRHRGVEQIVIDPGFGFAKSLDQNFELLSQLRLLSDLGCPLLSALSRKSMIYKTLDTTPQSALTGTVALNWESLRQGATLLRVHDVREAVEVVKLYEKFKQNDKGEGYSQVIRNA